MQRFDSDHGTFLILAGVLVGFGTLMVHSASITSRPTEFEQVYLSRHLTFVVVGLVAGGICAILPAWIWRRLAPLLFALTLCALVAVLVPGIGARVKGAQRWIRWGGFSMQPSELAKLTLPLCLCWLVELRRDWLRTWIRGPLLYAVPVALIVPLVLLQPDLGTSLFLVTGALLALFLIGMPIRNFALAALAVVPLIGSVAWMRPYQLQRVTGFLAAWQDWTQAPYQLKQSLVTIGGGGYFGAGLGRGWQKLSFLPEANTDFVFAVIGEELGMLGTLGVLAVWAGLYASGLRVLRRLPPGSFEAAAGGTLLTQLVLQAAINVAVVTALVPPKGISHPLVSYGGSNLIMSLVVLGVIVSLSRGAQPQAAGDAVG